MIDENVNRFCELVVLINSLNMELDRFYSGGYSFEDCYANEVKTLTKLQTELKDILKTIK